ncbi:MAG: Piwi domain-containing protein [Kiritimatiellae bacterium]|nr:Piwi domain-containing protein [Kiritimatiellia bacterium]
MNVRYIEEPKLQFGSGNHVDIRRGLVDYGTFDMVESRRPEKIRLGFVGSSKGTDDARTWIERIAAGVEAKDSQKPNLFPKFHGFGKYHPFNSLLVFDESLFSIIPQRELSIVAGKSEINLRMGLLSDIFVDHAKTVHEKGADVVVISYPIEIFPLLEDDLNDEHYSNGKQRSIPQLHDILKSKLMIAKIPAQIIRPSTCDRKLKRKETDTRGRTRQLQDEATIAWNFMIALYYKAGGIPWRIPRQENALETFYLGIGFYESLDRNVLQTSIAQVFNERGYGMIVRGGEARRSKDDRQVHMSFQAIKDLISNCLKSYRGEHFHAPARVIIHKTSQFNPEEVTGVLKATSDLCIDYVDMLSLASSGIRLYREGYYPPLRGTAFDIDDNRRILYTQGSVPFYEEYPGMYVPRSLQVRFDYISSSKDELSRSLMQLTKMNWNNCQMYELMPITIRAARQVGDILKYVPDGIIAEHYKYYM